MISIYSPDKPFTVYEQDFRWKECDASTIFLEIDFTKSVFEQFAALMLKVPKRALVKGTTIENTDYGNGIGGCKDCYLIFATSEAQNCYYSQGANFSRDCCDCLDLMNCEQCYQVVEGKGSYQCFYSQKIIDCRNSYFLYNCQNCEYCFGCVNLTNKQYYIFNQPVSKQEYTSTIEVLRKTFSHDHFQKIQQNFPHAALNVIGSEHVQGDTIKNAKDVFEGYDVQDSENIRYSTHVYGNGYDMIDVCT
jgi:hypothetical protein